MATILTLVPYKILPPFSGGQLSITYLHDAMGKYCDVHLASTDNNGDAAGFSFKLHKTFPTTKLRYVPFFGFKKLLQLAKDIKADVIISEHHYMAPTAWLLSKKMKLPWYIRSQNIEAERFKSLGKWWWPVMHSFEKKMMLLANGTFFITPEEKKWAKANYKIPESKAFVAPFGTSLTKRPDEGIAAKEKFAKANSLDWNKRFVYFLGAMAYTANYGAVAHLLDDILPHLETDNLQFLVAGKGLPTHLQEKIEQTGGVVKYLGFVANLDDFLAAMDIMINPVLQGGGIKTKAIEAMAHNKIVISTAAGAQGLDQSVCGSNLKIAEDGNWQQFANLLLKSLEKDPAIPEAFYRHYNWDNIAKGVVKTIGV